MRKKFNVIPISLIALIVITLASFFNNTIFNLIWKGYSNQDMSYFGAFISGTLGSCIALIGIFLIYLTYKKQSDFSRQQIIESHILRFENKYFQMINNLDYFINSLYDVEKEKSGETVRGIELLKKIAQRYIVFPSLVSAWASQSKQKPGYTNCDVLFNDIKAKYDSSINQIFKNIHFIYLFIESSDLEKEHKDFYLNYLKIHIPDYLIFIITMYKIHDIDNQIILSLVNELEILNDIDYHMFFPNEKYYNEFIKNL